MEFRETLNVNWQVIEADKPGTPPPRHRINEAKRIVSKRLGRRWTWRHDVAVMKQLQRWGLISNQDYLQYRDDYVAERARNRALDCN